MKRFYLAFALCLAMASIVRAQDVENLRRPTPSKPDGIDPKHFIGISDGLKALAKAVDDFPDKATAAVDNLTANKINQSMLWIGIAIGFASGATVCFIVVWLGKQK